MLSRIRKTRTIIASRTPTAPPRPSSNVRNSVVRFPTVRCNCRRDTCCRRLPVLRLCPFDESSATLAESVWRQPISSIVEHCCLRTVAPCKWWKLTTKISRLPCRSSVVNRGTWLRRLSFWSLAEASPRSTSTWGKITTPKAGGGREKC